MPTAVNNVITITTAEQLAALAKNVNDGNSYSGQTIKLGSDLDLNGDNWTPIGWYDDTNRVDYYFKGTFDGDNKTISNLTIDSTDNFVGLFGQVGEGGTVKNLTLTDVNVSGNDNVGGLVGFNNGTVTNCNVRCTVSSTGNGVGGIVGENRGTVTGSTVCATVKGTDSVGGLSGDNSGTVSGSSDSYYVGGLVGQNNNGGTVSGNTVSGTVSGTGNYTLNVGGIAGNNSGTVSNCTFNGTVSGISSVGGLFGANFGNISNCTVIATVSGMSGVGGIAGENFCNINGNTAIVTVNGTGNAEHLGGISGTNKQTIVTSGTISGTISGNYYYSNRSKAVDYIDPKAENVSDNKQLYKLTVPNGVEATATGTGNKVVADNGNYYAAGTVTLKASDSTAVIKSTNYTNNTDGTVSLTPTADTNISSSDIAFYYAVSIPNCVQSVSGTSYGGNYSDYYTGTVTLAAKTGYNVNQTSLTVTKAETITATLASGVYVFSTDDGATYQLATADNVKSNNYPDLQQAYQLTLPSGVTAANGVITADGNYYMIPNSEVTLTIGTGAALVGVTDIDNVAADSSGQVKITPTADVTVTADNLYYAVSGLDNVTASGGTYTTVSGTNYYKSGSSVTLTAGTGAIIGAATATGGSVTVNSNGTATLTTTSAAATVTPTLYYKLTLPNGFTASGTGYGGNYSDYYTGNVTIAERTGYSLSQTSIENISSATEITATVDTTNHYAFSNGNGYTYATDSNVATNNYPDLVQVYALTLSDGVTVTGDKVATDSDGKYYAVGSVTLTAAAGYTLQNVTVDGTTYDGNTLTVNADTKISADSIKFNNVNISTATGATVGGTTGNLSTFNGVYSISASQDDSTLTGNAKNNTIILNGGGENILTGGSGNDTYKFESGGGIVTDFGIGATKSGDGSTLTNPLGTDVIKLDGKVSGVYFDRDSSSKKTPTFTAIVTYDSTAVTGEDTQIIVLQNINKKPTKYGNNPVFQTNDVAAATMKIWDTSGSSGKQAVISAAKLKKLFHDDDELSTDLLQQVADLGKLDGIGELNLPAVDALNQTAQATFNGGDNG